MRFLLVFLLSCRAVAETINLTPVNSYTLFGEISDESVNAAIMNLNKPEVVFLVLTSPGGSVQAGLRLASFIETKPKLVCIANFAASMAFSTLQVCKTRLVLNHTIMMQHEAIISLNGLPLSKFISLFKSLYRQTLKMYTKEARRMKLSLTDYTKQIKDEMWFFSGDDAVSKNAADRKVTVTCTEGLLEAEGSIDANTPFGPIAVPYARCPLIR